MTSRHVTQYVVDLSVLTAVYGKSNQRSCSLCSTWEIFLRASVQIVSGDELMAMTQASPGNAEIFSGPACIVQSKQPSLSFGKTRPLHFKLGRNNHALWSVTDSCKFCSMRVQDYMRFLIGISC